MFAQDVLDGMQMTPKAFEAFPSNSWQNSYQWDAIEVDFCKFMLLFYCSDCHLLPNGGDDFRPCVMSSHFHELLSIQHICVNIQVYPILPVNAPR